MDATHSAAYILGVSKLYNFGNKSVWVGVETLKQSETGSALLRGAGNWHVHGGDNGFTHQNQIIGSGVGYGTDLQSFRLFYKRKDKQHTLLMQIDRIQREPTNSILKWTDFSWLIQPSWRFKQIRFSTSLNCIFAKNIMLQENRVS